MTRVYDCFTFSNELDLLEIRLNELASIADFFVIAESPVTFQGDPKPLYFQDNRERFAAFAGKIRHVVVNDMPKDAGGPNHWRREFHQRNALLAAISDAAPDDIILLSDIDEIPRATSVRAAIDAEDALPTVHCFELILFKYYLDYMHREPWSRSGPRMTRRRHLTSMQGLRDVHPPVWNPFRSSLRWIRASVAMGRPIQRIVHANSGWHFSYMGGVERVAQRLRSGSHLIGQRRHDPEATMLEEAERRLRAAHSDDNLHKVPVDATFPAFVFQNQNIFRHLLAPAVAATVRDT